VKASLAAGAAVVAATAVVLLSALAAIVGASASASAEPSPYGGATVASALAERDIPPAYLSLYKAAGASFSIDWAVLAAVGKVECDHGRDPDPSCTRRGAVNAAGAGGPMQFLASTFATYGVDGDGDGVRDRWNAADAIFAAARYLVASGARTDLARALYAYNHAGWYVREVEAWAQRYGGGPVSQGIGATGGNTSRVGAAGEGAEGADVGLQGESTMPVRFVAGTRAMLDPGDGRLALVPAAAPAVVQAMVVAGNELSQLPYGPGGHPDPRGALEEDCSSTINYLLYRSGVRPIAAIVARNPLAQDYMRWGDPGPGRWVTIYASPSHVFAVIAGLRIDTSHNGTDVGPNRFEDGPRWRILDHIPTWAHWTVRHPRGL
jgi:Transglycosylase SLT domain